MSLPVLLYHYVGPASPDGFWPWTISGERFERQITWLARRGYVGIRSSDWLAWRREAKPLPRKPLLVTFDDAYADLCAHAFPVLRRHGFSATVFVVTALVGKTNAWDERSGAPSRPLMTADQIREWAGKGIEFGAHSRTHPKLPSLGEPQLTEEIVGSRDELAHILGGSVDSFAYPHGRFNDRVIEVTRGFFSLAFTTRDGLNDLHTDLHLMHRTQVAPTDLQIDIAFRARYGWTPSWGTMGPLRGLAGRVKRRIVGRSRPSNLGCVKPGQDGSEGLRV